MCHQNIATMSKKPYLVDILLISVCITCVLVKVIDSWPLFGAFEVVLTKICGDYHAFCGGFYFPGYLFRILLPGKIRIQRTAPSLPSRLAKSCYFQDLIFFSTRKNGFPQINSQHNKRETLFCGDLGTRERTKHNTSRTLYSRATFALCLTPKRAQDKTLVMNSELLDCAV